MCGGRSPEDSSIDRSIDKPWFGTEIVESSYNGNEKKGGICSKWGDNCVDVGCANKNCQEVFQSDHREVLLSSYS